MTSPAAASRLDVVTVRSLDLEARGRCADGVWTPVVVAAAQRPRATRETWRADRCGMTRQLNFLVAEGTGETPPSVTALLPGDTQFTPDEQYAATPAVLQSVGKADCEERMVVTTEMMGGREVWTVDSCGVQHRVHVGWERAAEPLLVIETLR